MHSARIAVHRRRVVGRDHDQVVGGHARLRERDRRGVRHRTRIERRDLVVLQVGIDEARGRVVAGDDLDGPAVHAVRLQPGAILGEIFADGPHQEGMLPQEPEIEADIGPGAAPQPGQRIDQERHAQDVHLVRQDVVPKPAGKDHDVVVGDRAGDKNRAFGLSL